MDDTEIRNPETPLMGRSLKVASNAGPEDVILWTSALVELCGHPITEHSAINHFTFRLDPNGDLYIVQTSNASFHLEGLVSNLKWFFERQRKQGKNIPRGPKS